MIKNNLIFLKDIFLNILFSKKYALVYIIESCNWSIGWDGKYITENLNRQKLITCRTSTTHIGLRNKIIHFGSVNKLISKKGVKRVHPSNKIILTWFHIALDDQRVKFIPKLNDKILFLHTSCQLTKEKLLKHGAREDSIKVIPLGVDLSIFKPYSNNRIIAIKKKLGLPENNIIIGSFQKDGGGWKEGLEPKLEKGPDIFCDVVEKLSNKYQIHILLTGPARGYVKKRLEISNISYSHTFLKNYLDIVTHYNVLDLYIITSREEGGPKALLESMACGIPVITTRVGMAPDILKNSLASILLTNTDVNSIVDSASNIINNNLRKEICKEEEEIIRNFDWTTIASYYFHNLYNNLR